MQVWCKLFYGRCKFDASFRVWSEWWLRSQLSKIFSPTAIALGFSAILKVVKVRGRIAFGLSMVLWGRSVLGCQKVPRKVPPRFCHGSTKVSLSLFYQGSTFVSQMTVVSEKVLFAGFRQLFFTFNSQCRSGVKVAWVVDMSHPYTSYPRKRPIMSFLLGYSLGLLLWNVGGTLLVKLPCFSHSIWCVTSHEHLRKPWGGLKLRVHAKVQCNSLQLLGSWTLDAATKHWSDDTEARAMCGEDLMSC